MENKIKKSEGFFNKSLFLRIISILCAILLWFYVSAVESPNSEMTFDGIPISLRNKDILTAETGLSLVSGGIYETHVILSGKRSTLNKVEYEDITATADLSQITAPGTYELPVTIAPPTGTGLISSNPQYITVVVDKTISNQFEIEPQIEYTTQYELGECIISDTKDNVITSVTVTGPAADVERIAKVVARVDFGNLEGTGSSEKPLICLDINGDEIDSQNISLSPKTVKLEQTIYMTKTLTLKASQANNTFNDSQISFRVSPSAVEVKGDPKILKEMSVINLTPINEQSLIGEALTNSVSSLIKLPDGVELVGAQNTATITVNVKNVKKHRFVFTTDDVKIKGLSDSSSVTLDDAEWDILVINAGDKEITRDDIKLELNLKDYNFSSSYTINLEPEFKGDIDYAYFDNAGCEVTFNLKVSDEK